MFSISDIITTLLFPPACFRCKQEGFWLCPSCRSDAPTAWEFREGVNALLSYREPWVASGIQTLKYRGAHRVASAFGELLADRFITSPPFRHLDDTAVMPVPIHKRREGERGFNQAAGIARVFAERLRLPYRELLERHRQTISQASLSAIERRTNVVGSFRVAQTDLDTDVSLVFPYKTVILIDDVVTTGATLHEAASALRAAGVKRVELIALAYAPLDTP